MQKILLIIAGMVLLASCRSTRNIGTAVTKKDTSAVTVIVVEKAGEDTVQIVRDLLNTVKRNHIDYKTFNAKVNVDYQGGDGKNYNVNATVRMYRDSAIWISANAVLGIEALRVLVTKNSVMFLDKINKTYSERSLDYLQEVTALPLTLSTLQDLIVGNPVFLDSNITQYTSSTGIITLLSAGPQFKNLVTLNPTDTTVLRSKLDDADITRSRSAELTYSGYESRAGIPFATKRTITVAEKTRLDIKLDFKQYDFNTDVSFPFSVPRNYKKD